MTNLTIRIDEDLKKEASKKANELGIPLTLVVKTALKDFIYKPKIVIGEPENIDVTPSIQEKMNKIAHTLNKQYER